MNGDEQGGKHMILASDDPGIDPPRAAAEDEWTPESGGDAHSRMPAFARDFFGQLFAKFPSLRDAVAFRRWSAQPHDVYAFFDRFVIQIDPDMEFVIVTGADGTGEYGDWGGNDRTQDAIDRVRSLPGNEP